MDLSKEKIKHWDDKYFCPLDLNYYNYFIDLKEIRDREKELRSSADRVIVRRINNLDFLEPIQKGIENTYSFVFYGGNDYPKDINNNPKTFEEIAGITDKHIKEKLKSPDMVRLGILRLDVDNLGHIFKEGFRKNDKIIPSFSRYSTLSRNLDFFFSGYINTIWQSKEDYKNYTQIIYAGGDDVFIVGKWDTLICFAKEIYKYFKAWTCNNPNFGLSGGIAIVPPKFPLLKAAELAEEEEKNAKNHKFNEKEKNAISIFGYAFRWEEEFEKIYDLKNKIKTLLENKQIAQSFPSTIYNLMIIAYPEDEIGQKIDPSFKHRVKWLVAYNFKRAISRYKEEETKEFLDSWSKYIFTDKAEGFEQTKYKPLQILAFAARWADYELRSKI